MDIEYLFLMIGAVLLTGFLGRLVRQRTQIPESLMLISFGLLLGPLTGVIPGEILMEFVPVISVAAMITILVEAGIGFDVSALKSALKTAVAFTLLVAISTTVLISLLLVHVYGWPILHAVLLGLICSGTTTITTMSLLEGMKVGDKLRRLILLETIINDFTLILGTFVIVEFMKVSGFGIEAGIKTALSELSVAIFLGLAFGFLWRRVLKDFNLERALNYISTIGFCFVLYYLAASLGGNSIIAIFTFSLFLGNYHKIYDLVRRPIKKAERKSFQNVLDSIHSVETDFTFFIASFFFVLLGLTLNPALLQSVSVFLIGGILCFILVSRLLSSQVLSWMDSYFSQYRGIITVMIPRGYVAAVLAFVPAQEGIEVPLLSDIIVVMVIVTTIIAILGSTVYARHYGRKKD
ncbi:MAG: cation:proton antiporter [Candidatus Micrarchaeia archaeon]